MSVVLNTMRSLTNLEHSALQLAMLLLLLLLPVFAAYQATIESNTTKNSPVAALRGLSRRRRRERLRL